MVLKDTRSTLSTLPVSDQMEDAHERVGLGIAGLVMCLWRCITYLRGLFQKSQDRSVRLGGTLSHPTPQEPPAVFLSRRDDLHAVCMGESWPLSTWVCVAFTSELDALSHGEKQARQSSLERQ